MASLPLAYHFTFRTYGTWLHGDERWSVDKRHNAFDTPSIPPNPAWLTYRTQQLKRVPMMLDAARRAAVIQAVQESCERRNWTLEALAVRTNHVHIVARVEDTTPENVLGAFKANATRVMRERGCWVEKDSPWADGGSTRYLWKERDVIAAVEYVVERQGEALD